MERPICCLLSLTLVFVSFGFSQAPDSENLSLDALLNIKISLASRQEQQLSEAPSIVAVVTDRDIEAMGAQTFEEVLRSIAGFDVVINPQASNIGIGVRGLHNLNFQNNSIKFLSNGHTLNSIGGSPYPYINHIPLSNIDKIEIIRGPGSALYGANAFLGVINIITKKSDSSSHVTMEVGSFDTQRPSFFYGRSTADLEFSISGQYQKTDGYKETVDSDFAAAAFFPAASAAPAETTINSESFSTQFDLTYKDFEFTLFHTDLKRNYIIGIANALTDENELDIDSTLAAVTYRPNLGNYRSDLVIRAFWNDYNFFHSLEIFPEETTQNFLNPAYGGIPGNILYPETEGVIGEPGVDFRSVGAEVTYTYDFGFKSNILMGALYDYSKIFDPTHHANANVNNVPLTIDGQTYIPLQYFGGLQDISNIPNGNWLQEANRTNVAAFIQGSIDFKEIMGLNLESFVLTLGARHDDYDDIGSTTTPRLGVVVSPNEKFFLKFLYGEAFRAPTFDELYQINNQTNQGNPALSAEELETTEAQLGYTFNDGFVATLSYFDIQIKNDIQLVSALYSNIGSIQSEGFEFEFKKYWSSKLYAFLNFTYADADNTTTGDILGTDINGNLLTAPRVPHTAGNNPDWIANLNANIPVTEWFDLYLGINHTSKRKRSDELVFETAVTEDGVPYNIDNLVLSDPRPDLDARTLVQANLNFTFLEDFRLQLTGFNLLDEDWHDPDPTLSLANDLPREGSNFRAILSYRF
jgi:iron complex outermembrane receptor protein